MRLGLQRSAIHTPQFLRWFGQSKAVDDAGNPRIYYHGTRADFNEFRPGSVGELGAGIYFSASPEDASDFADDGEPGNGARVIPVYLRIINPANEEVAYEVESIHKGDTVRQLVTMGYDGVITDYVVMAFCPNQIKSALANSGEFNIASNDYGL